MGVLVMEAVADDVVHAGVSGDEMGREVEDVEEEDTVEEVAVSMCAWVSAHQKKDIWSAIAKDVQTLGVYHRRSTDCRKRWEDIRRWSKKTAEAQLGMASQCGRGACHNMTPLMFRILAVAYPELDGRLRASQQTQGATSGGGAVAPEHEGTASHMALEGETIDSEFTSGTESEGSTTPGTGADTSDTDSSSDGSSLVVVATSVPPIYRSRSSTSAKTSPRPVVPVVTRIWSAPANRAANVARSYSTDSPPPVRHQKLASVWRERGKTPATKATPRGPVGSVKSAVTPSKVGKGHKKPGKSGKSCMAEKTPIIPLPRRPPPAPAQLPRRPPPTPAQLSRRPSPAPAWLPRMPPPAPAQLPRRPPPAPAQLPGRPPPAPAQVPRRPPPAPAQLPGRPPPAPAQLGHEVPPAPAPLGHEGPPAPAPLAMKDHQQKPRWAMKDRQQKPCWAMKDRRLKHR
ncbi:hypothetical protein NDU88_004509 [Pleurodeles waltl]|uniref:Myb/SANT-like DNA-binding domain-containing protein n=1 Tax=Pleurodeles waltl TaxID=8319 RepID=A0AAV7LPH0_PLEWA|nr:hypothetical protein NDU88_004509 [Pleurodeles waltl]